MTEQLQGLTYKIMSLSFSEFSKQAVRSLMVTLLSCQLWVSLPEFVPGVTGCCNMSSSSLFEKESINSVLQHSRFTLRLIIAIAYVPFRENSYLNFLFKTDDEDGLDLSEVADVGKVTEEDGGILFGDGEEDDLSSDSLFSIYLPSTTV